MGLLYGRTQYNGDWRSCGLFLKGRYDQKYFGIGATINSHYDSGLDFLFNYDIEASATLWQRETPQSQSLRLCVSFGNLPEYCDNVKNLRVGLRFNSGSLWVHPEVSIPGIADNGFDHIRVLCSMGWRLNFKK